MEKHRAIRERQRADTENLGSWAAELIGEVRGETRYGGLLCYYFGLCFGTKVGILVRARGMEPSRELTLFVGTCSNWPLFG